MYRCVGALSHIAVDPYRRGRCEIVGPTDENAEAAPAGTKVSTGEDGGLGVAALFAVRSRTTITTIEGLPACRTPLSVRRMLPACEVPGARLGRSLLGRFALL